MKRSTETCRVCGLRRNEGAANDVPCDACGFVYLGLGTQAFDYEGAYDEKSSYNSQSEDAVLDHYRRAPNTAWALDHLSRLRREGSCASLFEIGASQGAFMALARDLGYSVAGVELSSASVRYGRERLGLGSSLELAPWRARRGDDAPKDVVCAFEVLEHSDDPMAFLRMSRTWLRAGGWLMLSVPNGRRLSVRLGRREVQDLPPHHLMYWTPKALGMAVTRAGLSVQEIRTSRLTHSDLLNILAPTVSARRAVETGGFRPVGAPQASRGLPSVVRNVYPLATKAGGMVASALNVFPEMGQRLMLLARA